jgi:hypothetical protein
MYVLQQNKNKAYAVLTEGNMIQCDKCFIYFYTDRDLQYHRYLEMQKEYEWFLYYFKRDRMIRKRSIVLK